MYSVTQSSSHNKSNTFSGFCSYFSCIRNKIHHIGQQDYDDFIATVVASHAASKLVPNGLAGFHNFLSEIKANRSCKKEFFDKIIAVVRTL